MTPHPALPAFQLEPGTALAQASPWHHAPVTLDSPALQVMTDLTQYCSISRVLSILGHAQPPEQPWPGRRRHWVQGRDWRTT